MNPLPDVELPLGTPWWITAATYVGFPALVAITLAITLWTVLTQINQRLTTMEVILQNRDKIFGEIIANQQSIIVSHRALVATMSAHETETTKHAEAIENQNNQAIRRLDDIFSQCITARDRRRGYDK